MKKIRNVKREPISRRYIYFNRDFLNFARKKTTDINKDKKLPVVLSQKEVAKILNFVDNIKHKAILYAYLFSRIKSE